jgi:HYR domain
MKTALSVVCALLLTVSASAGSISRIDPESITVNSGEQFITIYGVDLGDRVLFSGPAGDFELEISSGGGSAVHVWIPGEVVATAGRHTVTVLGGPTGNSGPANFEVTDPDPIPLTVAPSDPITAPATSREGAHVEYEVSVYGGRDPEPRVSCTPESGSLFRIGPNHVTCEATNSFGERATGGVYIYVYDAGVPRLSLPDDMVVRAEGPNGATVTFTATATDEIDGELPVTCNPPSGSRFPIGKTTVECTATDLSYNPSTGTFTVEVTGEDPDPDKLVIDVPDPITVEADVSGGSVVKFEVTASGTSDPDPDITCDHESGSLFPVATTIVECTATDSFGNTATDGFTVTVTDTIAPVISGVTATPNVLKEPNKKMEPVTVTVDVSDIADPMPRCAIFEVTSNEPIDGDVRITGDLELELRAERDSNAARDYFIKVHCTDAAGNDTTGETTVTVPHGNGQQSQPVTTPTNPETPSRKGFKRWW